MASSSTGVPSAGAVRVPTEASTVLEYLNRYIRASMDVIDCQNALDTLHKSLWSAPIHWKKKEKQLHPKRKSLQRAEDHLSGVRHVLKRYDAVKVNSQMQIDFVAVLAEDWNWRPEVWLHEDLTELERNMLKDFARNHGVALKN